MSWLTRGRINHCCSCSVLPLDVNITFRSSSIHDSGTFEVEQVIHLLFAWLIVVMSFNGLISHSFEESSNSSLVICGHLVCNLLFIHHNLLSSLCNFTLRRHHHKLIDLIFFVTTMVWKNSRWISKVLICYRLVEIIPLLLLHLCNILIIGVKVEHF